MKSEKDREIGKILRGIVAYEGHALRAATGIGDISLQGAFSGGGLIRIFGLFCRERSFAVPKKKKEAQKIRSAFGELGTPVILENIPGAEVVMCPSCIFNTCLLVLQEKEGRFAVTCYAYRNPLNGLSFKRQLKRLKRKADDVELKEIGKENKAV